MFISCALRVCASRHALGVAAPARVRFVAGAVRIFWPLRGCYGAHVTHVVRRE
jgi:hypothetical protein